MLTRVILAALVAGLLAGVFATASQSVRVISLILQAEAYEEGVSHAETEDEVWAPEEGLQRTFFTLLSNLVTGVAFALILTAITLILDQPVSLRHGARWGRVGSRFSFSPQTSVFRLNCACMDRTVCPMAVNPLRSGRMC